MKNSLIAFGTLLLLVTIPLSASSAGTVPVIAAVGVSSGGLEQCVSVGGSTLVDPDSGVCNYSSSSGGGSTVLDSRQEIALAAHLAGYEMCFIFLGPQVVSRCSTSLPALVHLP